MHLFQDTLTTHWPCLYDLVLKCWSMNPMKRPTAREILDSMKQVQFLAEARVVPARKHDHLPPVDKTIVQVKPGAQAWEFFSYYLHLWVWKCLVGRDFNATKCWLVCSKDGVKTTITSRYITTSPILSIQDSTPISIVHKNEGSSNRTMCTVLKPRILVGNVSWIG